MTPGPVLITVVVDPDNTLTEVTKANNQAARTIAILPPSDDATPPDLTATSPRP